MAKSTLYTGIAVTVTLLVVGIFFILGVPFSSSTIDENVAGRQGAPAAAQDSGQVAIQETAVGTGEAAKAGDTVSVNYTGKLSDGTVFDSSEGKEPITFALGSGQIIPGFEQGVIGMQVGGKRVLTIPPSLAYGPNDYGPIPGNSTLTFEIELVSIAPAAQQ
jgi:FKBP-type peptidyl-prolyl cis-trans isomerase